MAISKECAEVVTDKQVVLKNLLIKYPQGSFYNLLYKFMARARVQRQTAIGYVIAGLADKWFIVMNEGIPVSVFRILHNLKYLKTDMNYKSLIKGEKRFDVEKGRHVIMLEEEPPFKGISDAELLRRIKRAKGE